MKKVILVITLVQITSLFAQSWDITKYINNQKEVITRLSTFEKKRVDSIIKNSDSLCSIPRFSLKSKANYKCYEKIISKINFSSDSICQRLLILKDGYIVGSLEPISPNKPSRYIYSDDGFDKQQYAKITSQPNCYMFEIEGFSGDLWCVYNKQIYKISPQNKSKTKLIKASEVIAKNYGSQYVNDLIKNQLMFGGSYPLCD